MFGDQVVIYIGTELREAYLLRDILAEEGISAAVVSHGMSARLGLSAGSAQPDVRVLVGQADAARARQLAVRFQGRRTMELQKQRSQDVDNRQDDRSAQQPDDASHPRVTWPRCPECNQPRTTRCPICGTAGAMFPPADLPEPIAANMHSADSQASGDDSPACCISAACKGNLEGAECAASQRSDVPPDFSQQLTPEYICPTCDEPFRPAYHRRCQWCDYEFPDGEDYPLPPTGYSDLNIAAIAVIVALVVTALGLSAYLMFLF